MATGNRRRIGWATLALVAVAAAVVLGPRPPEAPSGAQSAAGESPAVRDAALRPSPSTTTSSRPAGTSLASDETTPDDGALPVGSAFVRGRVVDETGRAIPDTSVWWLGADPVLGATDQKGEFVLQGMKDAVGRLQVHAPRGAEDPTERVLGTLVEGVVPGGSALRVVLRRSPFVVGRIADTPPNTLLMSVVFSKTLTGGLEFVTGEGGSFTVPTGEAGTRSLLVFEREGFAPLITEIPALDPGVRHDIGALAFTKGRTLGGTVRGEHGEPIAGASVLVAEKWTDASRTTGPDGSYRFDLMPDRATQIRVNADGLPAHIVTIAAGTADATTDVKVDAGGLLKLRVVDADGKPEPGAHVSFAPDGDHPYDADFDKSRRSGETGADGILEARLQARGHSVRVSDSVWQRHATIESVRIVKGETTTAEVRLR